MYTNNHTAELPAASATAPETYGQPLNITLVIGFTNIYYTLWRITRYAQVENVRYVQNLSMDFGEAQQKVQDLLTLNGAYGNDFEIDLSLKGESGYNFFRPLAPKRYAPELLAFSRFAGTDMRTIDPNEQYYAGTQRTKIGWSYQTTAVYKKMSGLLWATYLNTEEKTYRGLRRRVIARQLLAKAGILIKVGREYLTPEQQQKRQNKATVSAAINGHHEVNGKRIELTITRIGNVGSFDTQYGTTYIFTFIDSNNRLFKYMGSSKLAIEDGQTVQVKATIKHSEYKQQAETMLQRIKINA